VSGEEYELLFTAPAGFDPAPAAAAGGVAVTRIGTVAVGAPAVVCTEHGNRVEITGGYDHFSR
jgi:thiamine monophosphate kinase